MRNGQRSKYVQKLSTCGCLYMLFLAVVASAAVIVSGLFITLYFSNFVTVDKGKAKDSNNVKIQMIEFL